MSIERINLLVTDGTSIKQVVSLADVKNGRAKVKAFKGAKFVLADETTGFAPENITVVRVGDDLHISLEGSDLNDPDLIIQNYYGNDASLIGLGEDGAYHPYISSDGDDSHFIFALDNGANSAQVLGAENLGITGFNAAGAGGLGLLGWAAIGALGLIGAAALAGAFDGNKHNNGGGNGGGGNPGDGGGNGGKSNIGDVQDNVGNVTGSIPDGGTTDDSTPTFSGEGTPGKVVTIVDNGKPIGSTVVGDDGKWEFTPEQPLPDGEHEIVVIEDGKQPSDGREVIIDTRAPDKVMIDSVLDDAGSETGLLANGAMTDDNTPTLRGRAEAGSLVTVYDNDKPIGSVMADGEGNWTLTTDVLPDGSHHFTATATDAAGNVGLPSDVWVVIVDTMEGKPAIGDVFDDVGDKQGTVPNGGSTDDNTPTIGGDRLTPGSTVVIRDGGTPIGSAIVGDDGSWEFTPDEPLRDDRHDFTIVVTDPVGNVSEPSDPWTIIIDTEAPDAPEITRVFDDQGNTGDLASGDTTDDAQPEIFGRAEANSLVTIYDGNRPIGSTMADGNGDWSLVLPFPLAEGLHNLTAKASDAAGNVSEPSNQFDLTVDTGGVPTAPSITGVADDVEAIVGNIMPGGLTNDARPTIIGTAPIGALVTVRDVNNVVIGSAIADGEGNWRITPDSDLADGQHSFIASAELGGVPLPTTGAYPIEIDTRAPDASTDVTLTDDIGDHTGPINDTDTTDDANPTYAGRAEPGTVVTIYDRDQPIGSVRVDDDGNWSFTPATPLRDGPHEFSHDVTDQAGNTSPMSPVIHFTVETGRVEIAITQVIDDEGNAPTPIGLGMVTNDTTPTVHGTATANSLVHIYVDGNPTPVGSVMADASGHWSFTPTLTEGPHTITATSTNAAGNVSNSNAFDLIVDITAPDRPAIGDVYDDVGGEQGTVPDGGDTDDNTPTIGGGGLTPGDTVIIRDGNDPIGTAIVGDDGRWEFTPNPPLNDGDHDFTIVVRDPAGNESEPSDPWTIIIDTEAPDAPEITRVFDDQGNTGDLASGDTTDDAQPEIFGRAEANSLVTIYDGNRPIGSTMADGNGDWSLVLPFPLAEGLHNLTAKASDAAGNVSEPSNQFDLTVDTGGVPTAPSITGVADDVEAIVGNIMPGGLTNDARPTIIGTAPIGALVTVRDVNNVVIGSAIADGEGNWRITPDSDLADGQHSFIASAELGGVPLPTTGAYPIEIDTRAPDASTDVTLTDDIGDHTGPINDTDTTDDANPTYAGRAEPGTVVTIYDRDQPIGSVRVDDDGNWSFTPATPLRDGPHEFSHDVTDQAGNTSPMSPVIHFTVETGRVEIAITQVIDDEGNAPTPIGLGMVTNDTTPTVHGTATANSLVHIYVDGNPTPVGSVMADASGHWSFTPTLTEGPHTITATSTNAAGNVSNSNAFDLIVDITAPDRPAIGDVNDDVGTITGTVPNGDSTDDNTPTIGGGGLTPGDTVIIRDGNDPIGTAIVGDDGRWEFTPNPPLNDGDHDFTIVVRDPAGNESEPSDPWTVIVDTDAQPPAITGALDDFGTTGDIPNGGTTDDRTPTLRGTGEIGAVVTVHDGTTIIGTAIVDGNGDWTMPVTTALAAGDHSFTATQVDRAGNVSAPSVPYGINVFVPTPVSFTERFEEYADGTFPAVFSGFVFNPGTLGTLGILTNQQAPIGTGRYLGVGQSDMTPGQQGFINNGSATFTLQGGVASNLTLSIGVVNDNYASRVEILDRNGALLESRAIPGTNEPTWGRSATLTFTRATADIGAFRIVLVNEGNGVHLDDVSWSGVTVPPASVASGMTVEAEPVGTDDSILVASLDDAMNSLPEMDVTETASFMVHDDVEVHVEAAGNGHVLVVEGANQVLDLTALTEAEQAKIGEVKALDITGTGDNTLNLSLADVLEQGGKDLFIADGKTQLMVKGDAGDVVNLDDLLPEGVDAGDWSRAMGTATIEGVAYNVFQHSGVEVELLVQQGVTTNIV